MDNEKHSGFDCPVCGEPLEEVIKRRFNEIDGYYDYNGEWIELTDEDKRRIINGEQNLHNS